MDSNAANGGSLIGATRRPLLERKQSRPADQVQDLAGFLVNPLQTNKNEARARFSTRALPNGGKVTPQRGQATAKSEEEDKDMIFSEESAPPKETYDV